MNRKINTLGLVSFLLLIFILTPVTGGFVVKADEADSLEILKNDISSDGSVVESSKPVYEASEAFLKDYTKKGSDRLEVELVGIVDDELILLAVNETSEPIKNLEFDLDLDGLFNAKQVEVNQSSSGTLEAGKIHPIKLELTDEEMNAFEESAVDHSIEVSNMEIENVSQANFWIYFVLNFIFSVIAYKLGFARGLPFKKEIFVYVMLAIGVYILTIFSLIGLPITASLIIISLVLGIYRYRLHLTRKKKTE